MRVIQDALILFFAASGLFFMLVAAIGVYRMPDLYTRMHAATKASTIGISGIAVAALFYFADTATTTRVILIILFFFLTAPVGAHALASAAYVLNAPLWPQTRRFDLNKARILCPIRGGAASQQLATTAIELARQGQGELIFLHVINGDGFDAAAEPTQATDALNNLRTLGQNALAVAQEQAQAQGITAQTEIRLGDLEPAIVQCVQEVDATLVVLGFPERDQATQQKVAEDEFWALAEAIQTQTGVQVQAIR
jgi:multicomponent Na+:H+ antiporter subunit G